MAKRRKASPEYLSELQKGLAEHKTKLAIAKAELYLTTSEGKLGQAEFENARQKCLLETDTLNLIIKEIARVERELLSLPELPFED